MLAESFGYKSSFPQCGERHHFQVCRFACCDHRPADALDHVQRGQRERSQLGSIDLRVTVDDAEVAIDQTTVEQRRQPDCFLVGQIAIFAVDVVQVILQAYLLAPATETMHQQGGRNQPSSLFLGAETPQEHIVLQGDQ